MGQENATNSLPVQRIAAGFFSHYAIKYRTLSRFSSGQLTVPPERLEQTIEGPPRVFEKSSAGELKKGRCKRVTSFGGCFSPLSHFLFSSRMHEVVKAPGAIPSSK